MIFFIYTLLKITPFGASNHVYIIIFQNSEQSIEKI